MRRPHTPSYIEYLQKISHAPEADLSDFSYYLKQHPIVEHLFNSGPFVVYLFDYTKNNYSYLSRNVLELVGYPADAVLEGGVCFFIDIYHKEDLRIFNEEIFKANLNLLTKVPFKEQEHYRITHTYRLRNKEGKFTKILQQNSFVRSDAQGNPLVSLGTLSNITPYKADTKITHRIDHLLPSGEYSNIFTHCHFPETEEGLLTKREIEILKWMLEGLTSQAIAEKLHLSLHTIQAHRKNMLEKTNAKNTADLIRYVIKNGLV